MDVRRSKDEDECESDRFSCNDQGTSDYSNYELDLPTLMDTSRELHVLYSQLQPPNVAGYGRLIIMTDISVCRHNQCRTGLLSTILTDI